MSNDTKDREIAQEVITEILVKTAKHENTIYYSDLSKQANASLVRKGVQLHFMEPYDDLANLLGVISEQEDAFGRPLLSALVINKINSLPGKGFFNLAKFLGYVVEDKESFFVEEVKRTHEYWKNQESAFDYIS